MERFKIINKIGEGAYSTVYTVKRLEDDKIYALKKVKIKKLSKKEKTNALNEVRILASIQSPYVIGYRESFIDENDETLCIIMEYADDGDLYQKIKLYIKNQTFFMESDIWRIFIQITKGLNDLHEYNILHRDLKSANVFLFKDGTAKLGDLNVSKITTRGLGYTQTGTPYYASPEVWKDNPYNSKSDIWSLGCVFYELIMLTTPFKGKTMKDLYEKVKKGEYPPIPNFFSPKFQIIIDRILKIRPEERPDAEEILKMPEIVDKINELGINMKNNNDINNNSNNNENRDKDRNKNINNKIENFFKTDFKINNRINFIKKDATDNITSLSSKEFKNNDDNDNNLDKNFMEKKIKLSMNNRYKRAIKEKEHSNVNKSAELNDKINLNLAKKYEIFKIYNDNICYFQEKYKQKKKIVITTIRYPKKLKNLNSRLPGVRYENNNNDDNLNNKNKILKPNPKLLLPIHKLLPKIHLNQAKDNKGEETKNEINDTKKSKNNNLFRNNSQNKKKSFLMNTLMQQVNKKNPFNNKGKIDIIIEE